jgi:hypothetical protein
VNRRLRGDQWLVPDASGLGDSLEYVPGLRALVRVVRSLSQGMLGRARTEGASSFTLGISALCDQAN